MGIYNNTPTFTWVKLDGVTITHNGNMYSVSDIKTNLEYIYWESDNPYSLRATNVNLGTSGIRFLILKNNKGEGIVVPNDTIKVNFDGNSRETTDEKIFGLYEKTDEHTDKFVTVEQDVNGIKQTVGVWSEEDGTISENISLIKQTSSDIELSVQDVEKTFNDNKIVNELRENINKSIIDFNAELGILNGKLYDFFKDNSITIDEKNYINTQLSVIESKKTEVVLNIDDAIDLATLQGETTSENAIISERDKFTTTVTSFKNYVTTAISDNVITPTEKTGVTNLSSKCNTDIQSLKNVVDDFIFLGAGGKVIEEFARIDIKSDEITSEVSKKVGKTEVISSINQSAEAIKIIASKIDINGAVTFSSLDSSVQTKVNKGDTAEANAKSYMDDNTGNLLNNTTKSGTVLKWSGGATVVNKDFFGVSVPVQQVYTSGDVAIYSDFFSVDPSKAYEVTMWMCASSTGGTDYFGLHAYNEDVTINVGVDTITDAGGTVTSANTNPYFWSGDNTTSWIKRTAYIMPTGTDASDMKAIGENIFSNARMLPNTKKVRIRYLNYYNSGTAKYLWVANTKVVEVDSNAVIRGTVAKEDTGRWKMTGKTTINGGQIEADTVTAAQVKANEIKTEHLQASIGITTPTITGGTVRTASNGNRLEMTTSGLISYNSSNQVHGWKLDRSDGSLNLYNANVKVGTFDWDTSGAGSPEEAMNRVFLKSESGYALKIESGSDMSIGTPINKKIYITTNEVSIAGNFNASGTATVAGERVWTGGNFEVQKGSALGVSRAVHTTITFPTAFSGIPTIVFVHRDKAGVSDGQYIVPKVVTKTNSYVTITLTEAATSTLDFDFIAVWNT